MGADSDGPKGSSDSDANHVSTACGDAELAITINRLDEEVLRVVLKHVSAQRSPFPISSGAELIAAVERTILLRKVFFWARADKPKATSRRALLEEAAAALQELDRDFRTLTSTYALSCKLMIDSEGPQVPVQYSGSRR